MPVLRCATIIAAMLLSPLLSVAQQPQHASSNESAKRSVVLSLSMMSLTVYGQTVHTPSGQTPSISLSRIDRAVQYAKSGGESEVHLSAPWRDPIYFRDLRELLSRDTPLVMSVLQCGSEVEARARETILTFCAVDIRNNVLNRPLAAPNLTSLPPGIAGIVSNHPDRTVIALRGGTTVVDGITVTAEPAVHVAQPGGDYLVFVRLTGNTLSIFLEDRGVIKVDPQTTMLSVPKASRSSVISSFEGHTLEEALQRIRAAAK